MEEDTLVDAWGVAVVVLVAVLVGAALPLMLQARATLRAAEQVLKQTGPKLAGTLDELHTATKRVNAVTEGLESHGPDMAALFESIRGLTSALQKLRSTANVAAAVGAAIGPALAAAVRGYRAASSGDGADSDDEDSQPEEGDNA